MKRIIAAVLFAVCFAFSPLAKASSMPDSFADLAAALRPVVVNISTEKVMKSRQHMMPNQQDERFREFFGDDFFKRFFGEEQPEMRATSLGSGFIWDKEGLIVTNFHVVDGADEIVVKLEGGKSFDAKIVGSDPDTDLAVLKITPNGTALTPVQFSDSDEIRVGDWVLAIGNPFGYGHTVTAGIISAKQRVIGSGPYDSFLQTDAAINPGNSGGPLFDIKGRVVGINTAIVSGGSGIGFAIPINIAKDVVGQLKEGKKMSRGWLGVVVQQVTDEIAESMGLKDALGALVGDVLSGGPADKAGIERGDVITKFDGKAVEKQSQLPYMVASHIPGAKVEVVLLRKGETKTLTVTLGERKGEGATGEAAPQSETEERFGLSVQELNPDLAKHLGLKTEEGLVVADVESGGPAFRAGIRRGDLIIEVNQKEVKDLDSYKNALKDSAKKESALFAVQRGKNTMYVVVKKGKAKK